MLRKNRDRERVDEWLSAYIDGALSPRERAQLEARLARDADLRARLESLQRTVALVRGLPPVPAPRNFLLTPAMVRPPVPAARRLAPALTFATAISGLLCVILLVGNLITSSLSGPEAAAPAPIAAYDAGISPQDQQTQEALAEKALSLSATMPVEIAPLTRAATASETAVPEMEAWSEEAPSLLEEPPSLPMGGIGGGAAPGPPPQEPGEEETETLPTPTPEPQPPERTGAAEGEMTAAASPTAEITPVSPQVETPEAGPASLPASWLPVGGLALMTAVLAALSIRAWRAR